MPAADLELHSKITFSAVTDKSPLKFKACYDTVR